MNRRNSREELFKLVFESEFHSFSDLDYIIDNSESISNIDSDEYLLKSLKGIYDNRSEIDGYISQNIKNISFDRLSKTTLAVLRVAVYEILYCDDIPFKVSINEALEIAKKYSDLIEIKFINGVLNKIVEELDLK